MERLFINVGFGNVIAKNRVIVALTPGSIPVKRLRDEAKNEGRLVDASHGRRTRTVLVTDSNHVVLSAIGIEAISQRLNGIEEKGKELE